MSENINRRSVLAQAFVALGAAIKPGIGSFVAGYALTEAFGSTERIKEQISEALPNADPEAITKLADDLSNDKAVTVGGVLGTIVATTAVVHKLTRDQ